MLWIGLHLPALSLESFAATLGAGQAGRALALVEGHEITQVDARALARGVRPGMKRASALAMAPDLLPGQADAWRDAQALRAVAHAALAFTPSVACADDRPAELRLEVQSCLRYFGGLPALLQRLRAALQPLGHRLQLATAPTASGAALLARWRAGLEIGPHSTDAAALRRLLDDAPLRLLATGLAQEAALQGMGLRTLADLRTLPRDGLARRFGPALLDELDRARGDAPEPHRWVEAPPCFASRLELFARADTSAQVLAGASILLARLVAWAGARQGRIVRFLLVMHHEPRHRADDQVPPTTTLEIALAQASADARHLQQLLAERLGRLPLAAPALELSLHCDALVAGAPPPGELFPTRASERAGLVRLIERLQARLGREQVCSLRPLADYRPERATAVEPADAARLAQAGVAASAGPSFVLARPPSAQAGLTRPVWLLPEPQALALCDARPQFEGRPLQLLAGPERLETGWWDDALVLRDYFIAATSAGALLWIYRARLPQQGEGWFLQGRFG